MNVIRTDYAACNGRGVQVRTFNDLPHARKWVREHAPQHDGLHLQEVCLVARSIYVPRAQRSRPSHSQGAGS